MNDEFPFDRTIADAAAEASFSPTIDGSPSPDPTETMPGPAPQARATPVTLPAEIYAVGAEIARGGMGCVLAAEDRKLGRVVAMKVMRLDSAASESARARFVREATVLARLEHPNIVPIHDLAWDAQNRLYYTMKLVHGRTLQAILNGVRHRDPDFINYYTLDRLLTIFRKICDAMSMAHAKGVIHRDLKPENVMVGEFGEVLVMDWGLARIQTDIQQAAEEAAMKAESTQAGSAERFRQLAHSQMQSAGLTLDGAVMGTPLYMSPEQAEGRLAEIDQQSDIFSLGGILYALLTLHPPVDGKTADDIIGQIRRGEILPPTAYNAATQAGNQRQSGGAEMGDPKKFQPLPHCPHGRVPSALSAVTMRALAVDKSKRYKTVTECAADIEAYQGGFATRAEQAGLFTQLRLLVQRHKREFSVAFAAWFVITALAVWFVINLRASERETRRQALIAGQNEKKAVGEATRATAAEQNARASEAVAVRERESARQALAEAAIALAEAARREGNGPEMQAALDRVPQDLRDSTWHYLLEQSDTSIARVRTGAQAIDSVAAHPRLPGVFAMSDDNGNITLMEVRSGVRLLEFAPAFPDRDHYCIAFSPDGERIAVGRAYKGGIVIHSARDGNKLLDWEATPTRRLEFSPDGKLLLQTEKDTRILTVWDAATGQLRWTYAPEGGVDKGTFTPDSRQVVTHGYHAHVCLLSAQDGTLVRPLSNDLAGALAVRPDGKMVVLGGRQNGNIRGVRLEDAKVLFEFVAHDREIRHIAFTPDGARFVSVALLADGRQALQLWDAETGLPLQTLLGGASLVTDAAVHPLSGELLVAGPNVRVWNLTGTPEKWTLRGPNPSIASSIPPSIAFWGSDDVVFAPIPDWAAVLQKLQAGGPELLWKPPERAYRLPSVSADGRFAAIGHIGGSGPYTLFFLCNPGSQAEPVATFKPSGTLTLPRLSPTGDRLAAIQSFNSAVALYDPNTGTQTVKLDRKDVKKFWDLGWLSGGQRLVGLVTAKTERGNTGSEEWIVVWDPATGKIVQTATNRTAMDVLAIAPDGSRFAEAGADKMVRIRDAATLAVQQEFRAHDGPITAIAWHPSKPILATASADLSVKLWNLETGRRLEELRGPLAAPNALAFSPSGKRLGCAGPDAVARIWEPKSLNDQPTTSPSPGQ